MKKILFPTDFSQVSQHALRFAIDFAKECNAVIDVWTVYQLVAVDAGNLPPIYLEELIREKRESLESQMAEFVKEVPAPLLGQSGLHYGIDISYEINKLGESYDLILMATQGDRNQLEKWLGSVTTHVLRHAPCPVLVIPKEATFTKDFKIVYATNFEEGEERILPKLKDFSAFMNSQIEIIHIVKPNETESSIHSTKIDFEQIGQVHQIANEQVVEGIFQFLDANEPSILSIFMPGRGLIGDLFHQSISKQITFQIDRPMLGFC
ncbi:MAG: universal stress protein [Bacteroidetes bacterium]|nr:universal stress protein [Bacteroidota bacterium]